MQPQMKTRYHGLDFARGFLMLLVVPYHASLIYRTEGGWRLFYEEQSEVFSLFSHFLHTFRSATFYIIAGFFFVMLIENQGVRKSLTDRVFRIAIPLMVVGFSFNFVMNEFSTDRINTFSWDYIIKGQWLGHLWFIGNLIFYYFVSALFAKRFTTENSREDPMGIIAIISFLITPVASVISTLIGYKIYSEQFLFITFGTVYKYFPYFILGMYLWGQRDKVFSFMTTQKSLILLSISILLYVLLGTIWPKKLNWIYLFYASSISAAFLAFSSLFILNAIGSQKNELTKKLADSSFTIYLLHNPLIIIFFTFVLGPLKINLYMSFILLCSFVFLLLYIIDHHFIKKHWLLSLLFNGKSRIKNQTTKSS